MKIVEHLPATQLEIVHKIILSSVVCSWSTVSEWLKKKIIWCSFKVMIMVKRDQPTWMVGKLIKRSVCVRRQSGASLIQPDVIITVWCYCFTNIQLQKVLMVNKSLYSFEHPYSISFPSHLSTVHSLISAFNLLTTLFCLTQHQHWFSET